jgi:hypothetical protein
MQLGHQLVEIPQRRQRRRAHLNLVEEQQGLPGPNSAPFQDRQFFHQAFRIRLREQAVQVSLALQVHGHDGLEVGRAPVLDQVRLADLARAADDQGLASGPSLPCGQVVFGGSLHGGLYFSHNSTERQLDLGYSGIRSECRP